MLFKERLLLSNCDSVRGLDYDELRKRILTGLTFAQGIVLSPNSIIDNPAVERILRQPNITRYLKDTDGRLVIRGFGLDQFDSLIDYYENLPRNFILSSMAGAPCKSELDSWQRREMNRPGYRGGYCV